MKRRFIVTLTVILLSVFLLGCNVRGSNDFVSKTVVLKDNVYGNMRITIWNEEFSPYDYSSCLKVANDVMKNSLKDAYKECTIIPMTVNEMYDYYLYPKGLQYNNKILLNVDDTLYDSERDIILTIVHEQLHFNGRIAVSGLNEEENVILAEYVVYHLSKKLCCDYDNETFQDVDYGHSPVIPELDEHLSELYDVYLGNAKLDKSLKTIIIDAFENTQEVAKINFATHFFI